MDTGGVCLGRHKSQTSGQTIKPLTRRAWCWCPGVGAMALRTPNAEAVCTTRPLCHQLAPLFPGLTNTVMKAYDIVGNVYIPADAVRCLGDRPVYYIFYSMMLLPSVGFLYALGLIWYSETLCFRPVEHLVQLHHTQKFRKQQTLITRGRRCVARLSVGRFADVPISPERWLLGADAPYP